MPNFVKDGLGWFLWWCVCSWVSKFSIKGFLFSDNRPFFPDTCLVVFSSLTVDNSLDAARSSWHGPILEGLLKLSSPLTAGCHLNQSFIDLKALDCQLWPLSFFPIFFVLLFLLGSDSVMAIAFLRCSFFKIITFLWACLCCVIVF